MCEATHAPAFKEHHPTSLSTHCVWNSFALNASWVPVTSVWKILSRASCALGGSVGCCGNALGSRSSSSYCQQTALHPSAALHGKAITGCGHHKVLGSVWSSLLWNRRRQLRLWEARRSDVSAELRCLRSQPWHTVSWPYSKQNEKEKSEGQEEREERGEEGEERKKRN